MHGDLGGAWQMNPLLVLCAPLVLAAIVAAVDFVVRANVWHMRLPRRAPLVAMGLLASYVVARNS